MNRRNVLKGMLAAPVVAVAGLGKLHAVRFNPIQGQIYFKPEPTHITVHHLRPGDYVHVKQNGDKMPFIVTADTLDGAVVELADPCVMDVRVNHLSGDDITCIGFTELRVVA